MFPHRLLIASALLCLAGTASSQTLSAEEGAQTLRGFRINSQCLSLEGNFDALRREGFKVAPTSHVCFASPGAFHAHQVLLEQDGKSELIELSFAPDSSLWRVKVSLVWEGLNKLSEKPTPEQVNASLVKRFGPPYARTADGALAGEGQRVRDGAHSVAYAWAEHPPADGPGNKDVDSWGWGRWNKDLRGTVTSASLKWFDSTSRQTLVVEMMNRWMLPLALEAQAAAQSQNAARKAEGDASMLRKL